MVAPEEPAAPDFESLANEPFLMPIAGVDTIRGRGTVVTGMVERGTLEPNTEIEIIGANEEVMKLLVTSIENVRIELIQTAALEVGTTFDVMEDDTVIANGVVTAVGP